jgi:pyrimidine-specific ribonucleoside hydrolase
LRPGQPRSIILDCDPGHDDALAMALALARPEIRVLGITTVGGNATLDNTTRNALSVLTLLGRPEIPVVAGAASPLSRTLETAPHVHGSNGLEGADLPIASVTALQMDVADFMAQTIGESETPVTLVPTGPLTNIATFRRRYPEVYRRVDQVVLMGGSLGEGNITPFAEFNIWVDPEAATEVFAGERPVTMMGLDVTHQALFTLDDADRLESLGSRAATTFADLLRFFARFHEQKYGWNGAPIHDAVAVAHLLGDDLVKTQRHSIAVSTDESTRGQTSGVPVGAQEAGVEVGMAIDRRRFAELLVDAVAQFP